MEKYVQRKSQKQALVRRNYGTEESNNKLRSALQAIGEAGQDEREILGRTREKQVFCLQYGSVYVRQHQAQEKEEGERKMTNNDHLNNITGETDTPEISAVKMILTRIDEDLEDDLYEENRDKYLNLYKRQKEWLEREVENE